MSYEIVKKISVKDGKVILTSAANNVRPHHYEEWECFPLSEILRTQGQNALEVEILKDYESGNFQKGNKNKYTRALAVLRHFPEYKDYDWRENDNYEERCQRRETAEFGELLKKALNTYLPKDKYIISKENLGKKCYLWKVTKRYAKWSWAKQDAKIFRYQQDAENLKSYFTTSENWEIEKIA